MWFQKSWRISPRGFRNPKLLFYFWQIFFLSKKLVYLNICLNRDPFGLTKYNGLKVSKSGQSLLSTFKNRSWLVIFLNVSQDHSSQSQIQVPDRHTKLVKAVKKSQADNVLDGTSFSHCHHSTQDPTHFYLLYCLVMFINDDLCILFS